MQDISFVWNVILITAFKTPQLIPVLNQLIPVSPFTPVFPPKYSKHTINKAGNHQVRNGNNITFTSKDSARIYFKPCFYIKKPRLACAYDTVCQHRYLQQTVNNLSCFQDGRVKNKLFVPTSSSSSWSAFIFSKYHTFGINNSNWSSQST